MIVWRFNETIRLTMTGDDLIKAFTIEWCPHCDSETVIWSHGVTRCSNCGQVILPCSVCTLENDGCQDKCPYEPRFEEDPMPDISAEGAEAIYKFL